MKKTALIGALIIVLSAGIVFAQMSNSGGMMGKKGQGMMSGNMMDMPMMSGMHMSGMMGSNIVATEDGGIVVMSYNKLYKFDKNLKLVKEADIPFDKEHIKKMMENMQGMGMMMGGMMHGQGMMSSGSQKQ